MVKDKNKKLGRIVMLTHVSYFAQRILLVVLSFFWSQKPIFQILTLTYSDLLVAIIQAQVKPLKTPKANRQRLYDDMTLVLIIDCIICCTDLVSSGDSRYAVGYFIVILTIQNLVINLLILILEPIYKMKLLCKWCFFVRNKTKGRTMKFAKDHIKLKIIKTLST